jgi:hypothetical protein
MSRRTIQSPGVEIREIDLTQRPAEPVGTSVFIPGFSNQGPTDEILNVGTFADFEDIYGKPTNAAERYFYHSVKQVFNSDANVYVSRLPYGTGNGLSDEDNKYTALFYPTVGIDTVTISAIKVINNEIALTFTEEIKDGINLNGNISAGIELVHINENNQPVYSTIYTTGAALVSSGNLSASQLSGTEITTALSGLTGLAGGTEITINDKIVKGVAWFDCDACGTLTTNRVKDDLSASDYYYFGKPTLITMTPSTYKAFEAGNFNWSNKDKGIAGSSPALDISGLSDSQLTSMELSGIGMIVLNKAKTTINNNFEGYYFGMIDGYNNNPASDFDGVSRLLSVNGTGNKKHTQLVNVPSSRLDFTLSATATSQVRNVSKTLEEIPTFNVAGAEFNDTLSLGVFKVRNTPFANDSLKLSYFLAEGYFGSLNSYRTIQNENGGNNKSFFIENRDGSSQNIKVLVNPNISTYGGDWTSTKANAPTKFVRTFKVPVDQQAAVVKAWQGLNNGFENFASNNLTDAKHQALYPLGSYADVKNTSKDLGSIPDKLDRVFNIASNVDQFVIDVSIEAGLGTIWVNKKYSSDSTLVAAGAFEDTAYLNLGSTTAGTGFYTINENMTIAGDAINIRDDYRTVFNAFEQFARETRKDHIFIADALRNIVVQGENSKVLDKKSNNFSQHVYWPLRHQFSFANSNYATVYGNWIKTYDAVSDKQVWVPFSGNAAGLYARNDANFAPWFAPAGYTRGIVTAANDIAISPTQRQRDQLYRIAINPVTQFPNEGIIVFGQKTLQRKPTAFDRVNVRRLFLDLEKRTKETLKFFIFEPNTFLTRTKVVNTLTPIFENAKQTEGVYDYLIVCDERNNTSARIENNELVVDIYLKPVRAAEFILVNFYAVNNDVNFEEIVGQ